MDLGETPRFSVSHPDQSCLRMAFLLCLAGLGRTDHVTLTRVSAEGAVVFLVEAPNGYVVVGVIQVECHEAVIVRIHTETATNKICDVIGEKGTLLQNKRCHLRSAYFILLR